MKNYKGAQGGGQKGENCMIVYTVHARTLADWLQATESVWRNTIAITWTDTNNYGHPQSLII